VGDHAAPHARRRYLCHEGTEKVFEALGPHQAHHHEAAFGAAGRDPTAFEDEKVQGAIRTDFILSAEIMAITLASVPDGSFWLEAVTLAAVGIGIAALVYGGVALIVKADDAGVALAANARPLSTLFELRQPAGQGSPTAGDRALAPLTRTLGRGIVHGMPVLLRALAVVGTAAMIWVGGSVVVHGLE
jgi:predicted DNA repair protein MutK